MAKGVIESNVLQRSILITLELIDRIVHDGRIEHIQAHQQLKVLYSQTCHLME